MTDHELKQVNTWISRISAVPAELAGTETGLLLSGLSGTPGKQLRPQLMYAAAAFGPDRNRKETEEALAVSGALIELTHLASLIHDDIVDDAPERRGIPSVQARYGKDTAVFAGDFLIARIHRQAAVSGLSQISVIISEAVEAMCAGEIGQALRRFRTDTKEESYYADIRRKTASLFQAALKTGAFLGGCSDEISDILEQFGEEAGILFQMKDDLADLGISGRKTGKLPMQDIRDGIYTLPVLLALKEEGPEGRLSRLLEENRVHGLTGAQLAELSELPELKEGLRKAAAAAEQREQACRLLLEKLPEGSGKTALSDFLNRLLQQ